MIRTMLMMLVWATCLPSCSANDPPSRQPAKRQRSADAQSTSQSLAQGQNQGQSQWLWHRTRPPEPDPAAKGLYRRLLDQSAAGQIKAAQDLEEQILKRYPESRFAARLSARGASSAAIAAAIGLAAATLVPLLLSR